MSPKMLFYDNNEIKEEKILPELIGDEEMLGEERNENRSDINFMLYHDLVSHYIVVIKVIKFEGAKVENIKNETN